VFSPIDCHICRIPIHSGNFEEILAKAKSSQEKRQDHTVEEKKMDKVRLEFLAKQTVQVQIV
jgi:hypothetical protein